MVRVLDLHLCDSGSNPTRRKLLFFFFAFFACHEFVDIGPVRVKYNNANKVQLNL